MKIGPQLLAQLGYTPIRVFRNGKEVGCIRTTDLDEASHELRSLHEDYKQQLDAVRDEDE